MRIRPSGSQMNSGSGISATRFSRVSRRVLKEDDRTEISSSPETGTRIPMPPPLTILSETERRLSSRRSTRESIRTMTTKRMPPPLRKIQR